MTIEIYSSSEEDEGPQPSKKVKKKSRAVSRFFDDEAEGESSSAESSSEGEYDSGPDEPDSEPEEPINHAEVKKKLDLSRALRDTSTTQPKAVRPRDKLMAMSHNEMGDYFNQRYGQADEDEQAYRELQASKERHLRATSAASDYSDDDDDEQSFSQFDMHGLKLWIVKCSNSRAKKTAELLARKVYFLKERKGEDLGIVSTVYNDTLKKMFYVEAHKADHVLKALKGIPGISKESRNVVHMVPIEEMRATLHPVPKRKTVSERGFTAAQKKRRRELGLNKRPKIKIKQIFIDQYEY